MHALPVTMKALRIHRLLKQEPGAAERKRIETALSGYSRYVRQQFMAYVDDVRSPAVLNQIVGLLEAGRINEAYGIVDSYVVRLGDSIVSMAPNVGREEAQALATQAGVANTNVGISFNPTSPQVVEAMQRNRLQFIQQVSQDQRLAINQALTQASREGLGTQATARQVRDAIGLTSYQQQMVDNYRGLIEANSSLALDRDLRDRRYDRGLENAIDEGLILPKERIDTMVDRYRERLLQMRAETIARTESGRVVEETRYLSVEQASQKAGVPRDQVVKQWMATGDNRTRDTHESMNGQARLLDDYFDSPSGAQLLYPHDNNAPAGETINCRCTVTHHFFSTLEEAQRFLDENGQGRYEAAGL